MPTPQLRLFVNYRRADDAEFVETLRLQFMNRYGRENVFMDFDSLPNFTNFEEFIKQKVRECDVLVMMIGEQWLDLLREKAAAGKPDYVLVELQEAIKHNKLIAPIRLRKAYMPSTADIPAWLHPVTMLNAPDIQPGRHLIDDITRIVNDLEAELERRGSTREVANPESQTQLQSSPAQTLTIQEMLTKIKTAADANNWPEALIWIDQVRQSGQSIPPYYADGINRREALFRQRLREEEDRRRRRDVADYEYIFIRDMLDWESQDTIIAAVQGIWQIDAGYIPDDLVPRLKPLMSPTIEVITPPSPKSRLWQLGETRTDDKGVPQVYVPAGRFMMGSDAKRDKDAQDDEQPQHEVRITQGFWLDQYPVTNAYFKAFTDDGGYRDDRWWSPDGLKWRRDNKITAPGDYAGFTNNPMQPRVGINWYEAEAYANWRGGRLPTEAEWEYTARGEQSLIYPWGNDYDQKRLNSENRLKKTTPVDAYPNGKSWCGAFDLSGNVWEWCADWYAGDFYAQCVKNKTIENPFNSKTSNYRVLRGGSWHHSPIYCRAASRYASLVYRDSGWGCRVVAAAVPVS